MRNEALDCEVYCLHAARSLKTNLMRDAHWSALDRQLRQRSLLDPVISDATILTAPEILDQADQVEAQPVAVITTPTAPLRAQPAPHTAPPPAATPAAPKKTRRGGHGGRGGGGFSINRW